MESCDRYELTCKFMDRKIQTIDIYMSAQYSSFALQTCKLFASN